MKSIRILMPSVFALLLTGYALPCEAQTNEGSHAAHQPGSWAMQFGFGGNFTITNLDGTVFSVRKQTNPSKAFRADLSLSGQYEKSDPLSRSTIRTGIDAGANWITILRPENSMRFYWGVGPIVSHSWDRITPDSGSSRSETSWSVGGRGIYGVEWLAMERLSIFVEHRIDVRYLRKNDTSDRVTHSVGLIPRSVMFGVSIWP